MRYKVGDIVVLKRKHDMYRGSNIVRINSKSFSLYFSDQVIGEVFDDKYIDHEETAELLKKDVGGMGMKDLKWLREEIKKREETEYNNHQFEENENDNDTMSFYHKGRWIAYGQVLSLINQLDEPKLPVIPEYVAEYIDYNRKLGTSISYLMNYDKINEYSHELTLWCYESGSDNNLHELARAWLDGYTVEVKKYAVAVDHDNGDWTYASDGRNIFKTRFKSDATQLAKLLGGRVIRYEEGE